MGNYCRGTATLSGDKDILGLISVLCQRLEDCAAVSGFDGDSEWLPHIFTTEVTEEGIFSEGCGFNGDALELYIRVSRDTGCQFFEDMADALGVTISWDFVSDYDNEEYSYTYRPTGRSRLKWTLRTEESLDEGDEDEDPPSSTSQYNRGGISTMHLGVMSDAPPWPKFSVPSRLSSQTYSAETLECLSGLESLLRKYQAASVHGCDYKSARSYERVINLLIKMQQYGSGALEEAQAQFDPLTFSLSL